MTVGNQETDVVFKVLARRVEPVVHLCLNCGQVHRIRHNVEIVGGVIANRVDRHAEECAALIGQQLLQHVRDGLEVRVRQTLRLRLDDRCLLFLLLLCRLVENKFNRTRG